MNDALSDPETQDRHLSVRRLLLLRRVVAALPRTRAERARAARMIARIDRCLLVHLDAIPDQVGH